MKQSPEFVLAKKMPLNARLGWVAVLAVAGIVTQLLFSVGLGWLFVFAAVLLGAPAGKSNRPEITTGGEWQNVTNAEFEAAAKLLESQQEATRSADTFSATSGIGCALGVMLLLAVGLIAAVIYGSADQGIDQRMVFRPVVQGGSLAYLFALDALTLLAPLWIFGRVKAWEPPNIRIRLDQLAHIYRAMSSSPALECQPCLQVAKGKEGTVPIDCKLMYKIKDTDAAFMGIQVQTSLNDVQGRKYPYTYCVLIAKPEFKLIDKAKQVIDLPPPGGFPLPMLGLFSDSNTQKESKFARFGEALVELKKQGEVDIAVVRQNTKGTGYTTSPDQAYRVSAVAYNLARRVLGRN